MKSFPKAFLNLENCKLVQSTIGNITKDKENLHVIKKLTKNLLFSENLNVSKNEIMQFLNLTLHKICENTSFH